MGENGVGDEAFVDGIGDAFEKLLPQVVDFERGGVLEHEAAVDVAGREDAGHGGFEMFVDGEEAAFVGDEACFSQIEHDGVRNATDGEEHALGGECLRFSVDLKRRDELRAIP